MNRLQKDDELVSNLEIICDALYQNNMANAMEKIPELMIEIVSIIEGMVSTGMGLDLLKELSDSLERINTGWQEKDHVYIADVLTFELIPNLKICTTR